MPGLLNYGLSNIMVFGLHLDELGDFEQNWKSSADKYLPGWDKGFSLLENQGRLFEFYLLEFVPFISRHHT